MVFPTHRGSTQATYLPPIFQLNLSPLETISIVTNLSSWRVVAHAALRIRGLEGLVDIHLSRPLPTDPEYEKWEFWSRTVA